MRAAVLRELNASLEVLELETPEFLEPGQVRVRMLYSPICGSQIGEVKGLKGRDEYLPHLLGHEGIGLILEVHHDSKKFKVGDTVLLHWIKGSGIDSVNPIYKSVHGEEINAGKLATFAEEIVCSENRCTRINPDDVSPETSIIGCALLTAYGVFKYDLNFKPSSSLLITGIGGIGQSCVLISSYFSPSEVFIYDKNQDKLKFTESLGLVRSILSIESFEGGFDYVIETTGSTEVINRAYELLNPTGTICLVGVTPINHKISIDPMPLHYGKKILGSFGGSSIPDIDIPEIMSKVNFSKISKIIDVTYDLESINQAMDQVISGSGKGKMVLRIQSAGS
jgi:S-(hydroxymethyl)glutathione dehydrogenase / alcohol dehydrogenase